MKFSVLFLRSNPFTGNFTVFDGGNNSVSVTTISNRHVFTTTGTDCTCAIADVGAYTSLQSSYAFTPLGYGHIYGITRNGSIAFIGNMSETINISAYDYVVGIVTANGGDTITWQLS